MSQGPLQQMRLPAAQLWLGYELTEIPCSTQRGGDPARGGRGRRRVCGSSDSHERPGSAAWCGGERRRRGSGGWSNVLRLESATLALALALDEETAEGRLATARSSPAGLAPMSSANTEEAGLAAEEAGLKKNFRSGSAAECSNKRAGRWLAWRRWIRQAEWRRWRPGGGVKGGSLSMAEEARGGRWPAGPGPDG